MQTKDINYLDLRPLLRFAILKTKRHLLALGSNICQLLTEVVCFLGQ
jgi:hypothetical protein